MERLSEVWEIFGSFQSEIIAFASAIVLLWIGQKLKPKVKIVWGRANNSFHLFPPLEANNVESSLYTEKYFIQNIGRIPAKNIDLIFEGKPDQVTVHPQRKTTFDESQLPNYYINVPYIEPRGILIIDLVSINGTSKGLQEVRCPDVVARELNFTVQRQFSAPVNLAFAALLAAGVAFVLNIFFRMLGI